MNKLMRCPLLLSIFVLMGISLPAQQASASDEFAITGALIYSAPGEAPIRTIPLLRW